MCHHPVTPEHPIILNNLFSHDSFEMRVLFSAFYRQGASCSFSELPLSPTLKGSHLSDSTQS